jgi:DNA-directed RNA polymerase subunit RPC12/RpoP
MKKQVICPRCGRRIVDTEDTFRTEAKLLDPNIEWKPDLYIKCWKCSSKIGIKVINKQ